MRPFLTLGALLAFAGAAALGTHCGGASGTLGNGGDAAPNASSGSSGGSESGSGGNGSGSSSSSSSGASSSSSGGSSGSGSGSSSGSSSSGSNGSSNGSSGGSSGSAEAGACPDEQGAYSVSLMGLGCGSTSATAPECITQSGCNVTLASGGAGRDCATAGCALAGMTDIGTDGSFRGAALQEGTGGRTGCTATWSESTSALTVDCGGPASTQSCIAKLTRTSTKCP